MWILNFGIINIDYYWSSIYLERYTIRDKFRQMMMIEYMMLG